MGKILYSGEFDKIMYRCVITAVVLAVLCFVLGFTLLTMSNTVYTHLLTTKQENADDGKVGYNGEKWVAPYGCGESDCVYCKGHYYFEPFTDESKMFENLGRVLCFYLGWGFLGISVLIFAYVIIKNSIKLKKKKVHVENNIDENNSYSVDNLECVSSELIEENIEKEGDN